jgi:hypothetical protein
MGPLRIQLSSYLYLVSICFIELNVLRIPQSKIYHVVNGDFLAYFFNLFVLNLLKINSYKCNKGHQGYSTMLPSILMLLYCVYMHDIG